MWIDLDPCFRALGPTLAHQRLRYKELLNQAIPADEWESIRAAVQRGQLTGNDKFTDEIERVSGLRIENRGQGRPKIRVVKINLSPFFIGVA
jgi:putative transposase